MARALQKPKNMICYLKWLYQVLNIIFYSLFLQIFI